MKVFVTTWCRSFDTLYGNELIFKTIRDGFPTSQIVIIDNGSIDDVQARLSTRAREIDAQYCHINMLPHWALIEKTIGTFNNDEPVVFLDPDVAFWKSVEHWNFGDRLLAGRLLPTIKLGILTRPRLHTSFLWVQSPRRLHEAVAQIRQTAFEWQPWQPVMVKLMDCWLRWDTGASIYEAMPERMHAFVDEELDHYDHLFCGTHLDTAKRLGLLGDKADRLKSLHKIVTSDHRALRGVWREQQAYFEAMACG